MSQERPDESRIVPLPDDKSKIQAVEPPELQYLKSVDLLVENSGAVPDHNGYILISFFKNHNSLPLVRIYRHISKYLDGNIGIQDEMHIDLRNEGYQANAEKDADGNYIDYPKRDIVPPYLQEAFEIINGTLAEDGSFIQINYKTAFVAKGNTWVPVGGVSSLPSSVK